MKSLANDLGPKGITVNSVGPGRIATPRMRELYGDDGPPPDEVAKIPARPPRRAARARGPRRVPLLEPRVVRQRHAHPGRRRPLPRASLIVRRALSPLWLALSGLSLLVVAFVVLWLVPSNDYIFLPDRAHAVDPLVHVQGGHPSKTGGIYFVDIFVRKASLIERLWPGIHEGAQLVPKSALLAPGVERAATDRRRPARDDALAADRGRGCAASRRLPGPGEPDGGSGGAGRERRAGGREDLADGRRRRRCEQARALARGSSPDRGTAKAGDVGSSSRYGAVPVCNS